MRMACAVVVFAVTAIAPWRSAEACLCAGPKADAATELANADLVVEARVDAHDFVDGLFHSRLTVKRRHKGRSPATFTVVEAKTCAVGFVVGERFLVYADRDANGDIVTNFCSRTAPVAKAKDDLAVIAAAASRSRSNPTRAVLRIANAIFGALLTLLEDLIRP